jgi:hypothetical protein
MPLIIVIGVMPVSGGKNHRVVVSVFPKPCADSLRDRCAPVDAEGSALAEVVLDINNQ